ncbi:MAG: hypothetical protein ACFFER_08635 [Candidatus Thorarchaeota archaeon]
MMEWLERLDLALETFDKVDLKSPYTRRIAVVPIYDFFQLVLLEVGVQLCGLPRELLADMHLNSRWRKLSPVLSMVCSIDEWNETIASLNRIRSKAAHNDYHVPPTQALKQIRKRAIEFREFMLVAGKEYYRQAQGFTLAQKLFWLSAGYARRAKSILSRYGEKIPLFAERDLIRGDEHLFRRLLPLVKRIEVRAKKITSVNDITTEDLDDLVDIARETERLDAREWAYIEHNKCPICGNDIVETQESLGRTMDDPEPRAIKWRIGCDKCDYEIASETIDL